LRMKTTHHPVFACGMRSENREGITVIAARECCELLAKAHGRVPAK
jgi:hypothetical protein